MRRKVYLEGEELEAHLEAEREAAELLAKQQAALERSRRMLHADAGGESDSESDSDGEGGNDEEADAAEEAGDADGAAPALRRRRIGGFTGGAGAWDEFLDADALAGSAGGQSFDIYVRGSFGVRSGGGGLQRFRMFPVVERRRRVDAYGEAIDVEGWLRRGQEEDPLAPGADQQVLGKRPREDEPEPAPEVRAACAPPACQQSH